MKSKEITQTLNEISYRVDKELESFYKDLKDSLNKSNIQIKDKSEIIDRKPKVADIVSEIPDLNEIERQKAMSVLKDITEQISKNKAQYGNVDLSERGDDKGSKEEGDGTGEVRLISVGRPSWFDALEKVISNVFKRVKKKEYFDVEGLVRGVTRKKTEKGLKRKNYIYLMLDVSGSMSSYSYKGTPLVSLFASYLPPMVKKYDGSFIEVDGGTVVDTEFKTLSRRGLSDKINLSGGGGAQFRMAMEYVENDIIKEKITDPVIIIATDGHEDFNFDLPKNTFFMTTNYGLQSYGWRDIQKRGFPNPDLNQKAIIIDVQRN